MVKTTLLGKEYTLRLTMGAVSTFVALTGEQVDFAYTLLSKALNEGYAPNAEEQLKIVAFVYASYKSACVLTGDEPLEFERFINSVSLEETYAAFSAILAAEIEAKELKKNYTQSGTHSSTQKASKKKDVQ